MLAGYPLCKNKISDRLNETCFLFLLHFYGSNGTTIPLVVERVENVFFLKLVIAHDARP